MKFVIITISLFVVTSIIWLFIPYFAPRYTLMFGIIPMSLSALMALALSLYKNNLKFEIKDKKVKLVLKNKISGSDP